MVPLTVKVPVSFDYVFPEGCLLVGVERVTDFALRGTGDDQARDKETGDRLWEVTVMDLHKEENGFRKSQEVKVKIAAPHQPVAPSPTVPGFPPKVAFTDLVLTPWVDSSKCTGRAIEDKGGKQLPHKCRSRLSWSIRASSIVAADDLVGVR
jgi:hypothetical protein